MIRPAFEAALRDLTERLSQGQFVTAAQISAMTHCSKRVANKRLRVLHERGYRFQTVRLREGRRGPEAVGYAIVVPGCVY